MENEKKSNVGGLFAMKKSADNDNVCYYQQAAAPTESSIHFPKDEEDCVGGFFGKDNSTSVAFAAAKPNTTSHLFSHPTTTSHLFSHPRIPRLVEESFDWTTPQTAPFNQVDYKLYDNRLASFAFWSCSDVVKPAQLARAGFVFAGLCLPLV